MSPAYSLFGLTLEASRPLPGLVSTPAGARADVQLRWDELPAWASDTGERDRRLWYRSPDVDARGRAVLSVWELECGGALHLRYADGAEFVVDTRGSRVWAGWSGAVPADDALSYLLGPVWSLVLRLRGIASLHASAVAVGDSAVAFVGPVGAGKSTTAAVFAGRGYAVLSDDLVALEESGDPFRAAPGFPWLRLRPESVGAIAATARTPPRLTPTGDGRYVDLDLTHDGYRFQARPLPLAALYLLDGLSIEPATPRVETSSGAETMMALVANSWTTRVLDRSRRAREFELLGAVAAGIRCRRLRVPRDPAGLSRLCDAIEEDLEDMALTGAPRPARCRRRAR